MTLLEWVDPRLQATLRGELERRRPERQEGLPRGVTVVLAGHRAAGKTQLLEPTARLLCREGVDLDHALERQHGRALREWVQADEASFRAAERALFQALPPGLVVSVGGGFLSHHADLLRGLVTVEVPVTFETYRERLLADATRPRLLPGVPLEEELRAVFAEREERHRAARPISLVDLCLRAARGLRPRRVVTLPPGARLEPFAWRARHEGAELLEVRTDLHPKELDLLPAIRALPLLLAERDAPLPFSWRRLATLVDAEQGRATAAGLRSHHASRPLSTAEALALWPELPPGVSLKHVEPLGAPADFPRLLATQAELVARFGAERVTVLATGALAAPFRAVLAERNALDYLALDADWQAAPGQLRLADARRAARGAGPRLGLLGSELTHARSPRLHAPPFDRLDLPPDAPLGALLAALHAHYRGFAVTTPFKKLAARAVESPLEALNTLVRTADGWRGENSDVAGAEATLEALGAAEVTVLGDGGVTVALREAAARGGVTLQVLPRAGVTSAPVRGAVVWTWPASVEAPPTLRFESARVAVIAYGAPGRAIARTIAARGGEPLRLGPRWFIAQARRQRTLWESAQ